MTKNISIDLVKKSKKWNEFKNAEKFICTTIKKLILETEISQYKKPLELTISLLSNAQISKINLQFRKKNKATNVLSFSFLDEELIREIGFKKSVNSAPQIFLGDIILAYETIKKEAKEQEKKFEHHLTHLLLHALLHLIGYDHEQGEKEAVKMEKIETKILKKLGIKNPY